MCIDFPESADTIIEKFDCFTCPIKTLCESYEGRSDDEKRKGCSHLLYIKKHLTAKVEKDPINLLKSAIVDVNVKLKVQKMLDGKVGLAASREYIDLMKINISLLDMGWKYGRLAKKDEVKGVETFNVGKLKK